MLRFARHMRGEQNGGDTSQPSIQEDLLVLVLRHYGHYWNIGLCLLGESARYSLVGYDMLLTPSRLRACV